MIKLAFMVDTAYTLITGTKEGSKTKGGIQPADFELQMKKITVGDHYAAGRKSAGYLKKETFKPGTKLYIVSRNLALNENEESKTKVVNDYMDLVNTYKDSKDCLTIIGGKEIFMLFLPYASSIDVAMTDKKIPGDVVFKEWKTFNLRLKKVEEWKGGITYYYTKRPAPVY